jgi:hypothetical protein
MRNMHTKVTRRRSRRMMPLSAFGDASMLMSMLRDRVIPLPPQNLVRADWCLDRFRIV